MNRNLYAIIFFLLFFSQFSFGQSLTLVYCDSAVSGEVGSTLQASIVVKNTSQKAIYVKVEKIAESLSGDHSAYFRLDEKVNPIRKDISLNAVRLEPGQILEDFIGYLSTGKSDGVASITYRFFNERNPSDFVEHTVTYEVQADGFSDNLIESADIIISKIYPNPATSFAGFNYKLGKNQQNAVITIRNVLGSEVGKYELSANETSIRFPLDAYKSGIYFYTLSLNDQTLVSQKFMVKK